VTVYVFHDGVFWEIPDQKAATHVLKGNWEVSGLRMRFHYLEKKGIQNHQHIGTENATWDWLPAGDATNDSLWGLYHDKKSLTGQRN
jgi:hypothetical protein